MTRILVGDALERLRELPDGSVHCCVTSPPYWGLRSYEGDPGMIGLEPTFDEHLSRLVEVFREVRRVLRDDGTCWVNYGDAYARGEGRGGSGGLCGTKQGTNAGSQTVRPGPLGGLKPKDLMMMPARVALALQQPHLRCLGCEHVAHALKWGMWPNGRRICPGCEKSKGADIETPGWWLRSEIVWHKPNPMPESCTDRPTSAHEKLFLLTKAARYFYDADAVRVPLKEDTIPRYERGRSEDHKWADGGPGDQTLARSLTHMADKHRGQYAKPYEGAEGKDFADSGAQDARSVKARIVDAVRSGQVTGANLRNVWTIPTNSFSAAHFATFPPALVEIPIKAGTSARGVCATCGAPWVRETEGWAPSCCDCHVLIATPQPDGVNRPDPTMDTGRKGMNRERNPIDPRIMTRGEQRDYARQIQASPHRDDIRRLAGEAFAHYVRTDRSGARPLPPDVLGQCLDRGWLVLAATDCDCACKGAATVPATVLDPFGGSGTVALVADRLQRDAILIEISATYAEMAEKRIRADAPLLTDVTITKATPARAS